MELHRPTSPCKLPAGASAAAAQVRPTRAAVGWITLAGALLAALVWCAPHLGAAAADHARALPQDPHRPHPNAPALPAGKTLDQMAWSLRARGLQVQTVHAVRSNAEAKAFRIAAAAALRDPQRLLIVNYDRRRLGQDNAQGAGHHAPLGAYDAATDRMLVMDAVTQGQRHIWVAAGELWSAMATIDGDTGRMRGYLLVSLE
jgi:hypothetical protein